MRWTSFALIAAGLAALAAAGYFAVSGSDSNRVVLAAQQATSTPSAILSATATRTATVEPTPQSASPEEAPPPEAPIEPVQPAATQPSPAPTATPVPSAPTATPSIVAPETAAAIAPPAPTATTAPPPPPPTATPVPAPPPAAPASFGALEQQMFAAHNAERAAAGLPLFQSDAALSSIARVRATDMATNNYFSHTSPSGQTAFSLLNSSGYRYSLGGENLARNNYPDSQTVSVAMSGLMGSATHRANILNPAFRNVGIALVVAADGMKYFAIVYAAP